MRFLRQTVIDANRPSIELDAGSLLLRRFGVFLALKINEPEPLGIPRLSVVIQHHFLDGPVPREQLLQRIFVGPPRESKAAQNPRHRRVLPLVPHPAARPSRSAATAVPPPSIPTASVPAAVPTASAAAVR